MASDNNVDYSSATVTPLKSKWMKKYTKNHSEEDTAHIKNITEIQNTHGIKGSEIQIV